MHDATGAPPGRLTWVTLLAVLLVGCGSEKTGTASDGGPGVDSRVRPMDGAIAEAGADGSAPGLDGASPEGALDSAPAPDDAASADLGARDAGPGDLDAGDPPGTWRSVLFPRDWRPVHAGGRPDAEGRFLPDFAYAGWHRGSSRPPYGAGAPTVTVDAALGDGASDATAPIQAALDDTCAAGGGVVLLPAGTYRVRLPAADASAVLHVDCSHLVLRGEGPESSRLLVDDARRLREKAVIAVRGRGSIRDGASTPTFALAADLLLPAVTVTLASAAPVAPGDWVVVRNDNGDALRAEHRMDEATSGEPGLWPESSFRGLLYPRRVVAVEGANVTLDGPIHAPLRTRDAARLYALPPFLEEVGLESFAIGMVENRTSSSGEPAADDDFGVAGTTGHEVHGSRAIELDRVHDAWIHDVDTFRPEGNDGGSHVLSNGILLEEGAFRVTVEGCDWASPQYRGGGGNGYLFHFQGHDALVLDSSAVHARHGFIFNHASSGNVLLRVTTTDSRYSDDSHRFLANANLYDQVRLDRGWLQAVNRGTTSSGAGFTSTRHVFWRTRVLANHRSADGCAVESAQWEHGYLIGSSAAAGATARLCPESFSNSYWAGLDQGAPEDFVEGEDMGETLWPTSLFSAQLALRCAREGMTCISW